jgi:hypothetical protein
VAPPPSGSAATPAAPDAGSTWGDAIDEAFGPGARPRLSSGEAHAAGRPWIRQASPMTVSGRLPPEVIQAIVRQEFRRFDASCYLPARKKSPALTGHVIVELRLDRSGAVVEAKDAGSELPDARVVACVVRAFKTLSFPQPVSGEVDVTFPMMFGPPD